MPAIRLNAETENRLDLPVKTPGKFQTFHAREAALEDSADIYLATQRLRHPTKTYSAEEVRRELDLQVQSTAPEKI